MAPGQTAPGTITRSVLGRFQSRAPPRRCSETHGQAAGIDVKLGHCLDTAAMNANKSRQLPTNRGHRPSTYTDCSRLEIGNLRRPTRTRSRPIRRWLKSIGKWSKTVGGLLPSCVFLPTALAPHSPHFAPTKCGKHGPSLSTSAGIPDRPHGPV
jgi:hypothetical protein